MRLASDVRDAQGLAEGLAEVGARWKPATVKIAEMSLVYEKKPYMHLSRADGEAHTYSLPFF